MSVKSYKAKAPIYRYCLKCNKKFRTTVNYLCASCRKSNEQIDESIAQYETSTGGRVSTYGTYPSF